MTTPHDVCLQYLRRTIHPHLRALHEGYVLQPSLRKMRRMQRLLRLRYPPRTRGVAHYDAGPHDPDEPKPHPMPDPDPAPEPDPMPESSEF